MERIKELAELIERNVAVDGTYDTSISGLRFVRTTQISEPVYSFYNHFKEVTGMSPIQFQKQLRLQEARRLLLTENLEAAEAAFQVGYESPSHFSREYSRKFGLTPMKDIRRLREMYRD